MGEVREADFYNAHFQTYKSRLLESNWLGLYLLVALWLQARKDSKWDDGIIDLGCGNGHFAELLWARGVRQPYLGLDFSSTAIYQAENNVISPHFSFQVEDLRNDLSHHFAARSGTVVCLETLEHLDEDVALLEQIPSGRHIIASVPNYNSEGHARFFPTRQDVYDRYQRHMTFRRWGVVDLSPPDGREIHVFEGWRR